MKKFITKKSSLQVLMIWITTLQFVFIFIGWATTSSVTYLLEAPIVPEVSAAHEIIEAPVVTLYDRSDPVIDYIYEKFGEDAERGITMLKTCENSTLNPFAVNWNGNGTVDIGLWQHNLNPEDKEEWARLEDPYYSTDLAWEKFVGAGYHYHTNSFYLWTCGYIVNDYTYLDYIRGN